MDSAEVDVTFITQWLKDCDPSVSPEMLQKAQNAYRTWHASREPRHAIDTNDDLTRANNVLILGPRRDFQNRKVHLIYAENKTRGRVFSYSLDLSIPKFSALSPIELGSFIARPGLSEFEEFGHREAFLDRSWASHLYYDDSALNYLLDALRSLGIPLSRSHSSFNDLKEHTYTQEKYRTAQAMKQFIRGLDRTAYVIMRSAGLSGGTGPGGHLPIRAYEWLCGSNESQDPNERDKIVPLRASTGDALRNRRDAGRQFGGLLEYITTSPQTTQSIESGMPRVEALTRRFGRWSDLKTDNADRESREYAYIPSSPEFIRWLRGRKWQELHGQNMFQYDRIYSAFAVAAALPREWRPCDARDWKAYHGSKDTIDKIAALTGHSFPEVTLAIARIFNRKSGYPSRVLRKAKTVQAGFRLNFEKEGELGNLSDFLSAVSAQLILPALAQTAQAQGYPMPHPNHMHQWTSSNPIDAKHRYDYTAAHLACRMFTGMSVSHLIKYANRWHQRLNHIQTHSMKLDGAYEWPALFEGAVTTQDGTVSMSCLTSTADLIYAGKRFDNCVGGYTFKCVYGESHIIQLENQNTLEQALMEVRDVQEENGRTFKIELLQLESPSNKAAEPWAAAAARELIQRMNKQRSDLVIDYTSLNRRRQQLRDDIGIGILTLKTGFDPLNTEYADNAYQVLRHELRGMFLAETRTEYLIAKGIIQELPARLKAQQEWNKPRV